MAHLVSDMTNDRVNQRSKVCIDKMPICVKEFAQPEDRICNVA